MGLESIWSSEEQELGSGTPTPSSSVQILSWVLAVPVVPSQHLEQLEPGWGRGWRKQGQTWVASAQQPNFEPENHGGERTLRGLLQMRGGSGVPEARPRFLSLL